MRRFSIILVTIAIYIPFQIKAETYDFSKIANGTTDPCYGQYGSSYQEEQCLFKMSEADAKAKMAKAMSGSKMEGYTKKIESRESCLTMSDLTSVLENYGFKSNIEENQNHNFNQSLMMDGGGSATYVYTRDGQVTARHAGDYSIQTSTGTTNFRLRDGETHSINVKAGDRVTVSSPTLR